jgi:hypothetical protein
MFYSVADVTLPPEPCATSQNHRQQDHPNSAVSARQSLCFWDFRSGGHSLEMLRLLLERAEWQLSLKRLSVTDIGLNANLSIARSVLAGVPKSVPRFIEPLSAHGREVHTPARAEWNSSPFRAG